MRSISINYMTYWSFGYFKIQNSTVNNNMEPYIIKDMYSLKSALITIAAVELHII